MYIALTTTVIEETLVGIKIDVYCEQYIFSYCYTRNSTDNSSTIRQGRQSEIKRFLEVR